MASAAASTLMAVLRTLRPDATWRDVERWVRSTTRNVEGRPVLDGEAAARAAGLNELLARARSRMPKPTAPESPPEQLSQPDGVRPSNGSRGVARIGIPTGIRARWLRGRLRVSVSELPRSQALRVVAVYIRGELRVVRQVTRTRAARSIAIRLGRPPRRIEVTAVRKQSEMSSSSQPVVLYRRANNRYLR